MTYFTTRMRLVLKFPNHGVLQSAQAAAVSRYLKQSWDSEKLYCKRRVMGPTFRMLPLNAKSVNEFHNVPFYVHWTRRPWSVSRYPFSWRICWDSFYWLISLKRMWPWPSSRWLWPSSRRSWPSRRWPESNSVYSRSIEAKHCLETMIPNETMCSIPGKLGLFANLRKLMEPTWDNWYRNKPWATGSPSVEAPSSLRLRASSHSQSNHSS